jgi:hypothetical protein
VTLEIVQLRPIRVPIVFSPSPTRIVPACPETCWFESSASGPVSVLSVIGGLHLDRWDVTVLLVEAWWLNQSTHSAVANST